MDLHKSQDGPSSHFMLTVGDSIHHPDSDGEIRPRSNLAKKKKILPKLQNRKIMDDGLNMSCDEMDNVNLATGPKM